MLQPKKPVVKKTTKKTKSASEKIGNITLRDVKNAGEDALQIATLGGYGKMKKSLGSEYKHKKIGEKKYGGKVTKAKNGKSFPDLNKDGKITKADILKGRGVIAKNGKPVEKAFLGKMLGGVGKSVLGGLAGKAIGGLMGGKDGKTIKKAQSGTSVDRNTPSDISKMRKWYKDKNTPGKDRNTPAEVKKMRESYRSGEMKGKKAKSGTSMKKCKYGCK